MNTNLDHMVFGHMYVCVTILHTVCGAGDSTQHLVPHTR